MNEIELIDRSCAVEIDINSKSLKLSYRDYQENTVEIDSCEGINILDKWYYKWSNFIKNLYNKGCNINIDLSGGFDSRVAFVPVLGSGIDLNNVLVHPADDKLHAHIEVFEIASMISKHYGFSLNNKKFIEKTLLLN